MATLIESPQAPARKARRISNAWMSDERLFVIGRLTENGKKILRNGGRIDRFTAFNLFEATQFVAIMSAQFLNDNRKQILEGLEGIE